MEKSQILSSMKRLRHDDMSRRLQIKHSDKINWELKKKTQTEGFNKDP